MAISRATATSELAARTGRVLVTVGLTAADTTGNLKEALDDTFRAMGTAYADLATATVDTDDLDQFLAIGAVYVLRRALDEAVGFADVAATTLGTSKRKSQIVANLRARLADAEAEASVYGVVALSPVMGAGTYYVDVIEPDACEVP